MSGYPGVGLQVVLVLFHGTSGLDPRDLEVEALRHLLQQRHRAGVDRFLADLCDIQSVRQSISHGAGIDRFLADLCDIQSVKQSISHGAGIDRFLAADLCSQTIDQSDNQSKGRDISLVQILISSKSPTDYTRFFLTAH